MDWMHAVWIGLFAFVLFKLKQYSKVIALLDKGQQDILDDLTRPPAKRGRC